VSNSLCNNRGISLIEISIATLLTLVAVLAILSLQPRAWNTALRSDYLGRASGIMYRELASNEALLMNCCNAVPAAGTRTVLASLGASPSAGDAVFTVQTAYTDLGGNVWRVTVGVSWAAHPTPITDSVVVTRQNSFTSGCGVCP
jgi:Tfp pilus assembly protein PilV